MVAVVRIDAQLVHDLKLVFAPVPDIDERVSKRRAIVANEVIALAEDPRGDKNVGGNEFIKKALELAISKPNAVEHFKLLSEISLQVVQVVPVADILAIGVFQALQLLNEVRFYVSLVHDRRTGIVIVLILIDCSK